MTKIRTSNLTPLDGPEHNAEWLKDHEDRRKRWARGHHCDPLGPRFFRYQIPQMKWVGGDIDPLVLAMLATVSPLYEIIYDGFTTLCGKNGRGPAFHLVTRRFDGVRREDDLLVYETSIQKELLEFDKERGKHKNPLWGDGTPVVPTVAFMQKWLPILRLHHHGPAWKQPKLRARLAFQRRERRLDKEVEARRKTNKAELARWNEIAPYFDAKRVPGGCNRTIRRTGLPLFKKPKTEKISASVNGLAS